MQRISAPGESTMAADLPASTSALSNRYEPGESSQSLLSRRGSSLYNSSRFLQVDDTGVYLTSLAITILITATVTILILLFTLIITLAILLASCQNKPDVVVKQGSRALDRVDVCRSFALNFELNNLRGNGVFPNTCEEYVFHYMRSGQYENDVKETVMAAESYWSSVIPNVDGFDAVLMEIDETALSNVPYYNSFQLRSQLHNESAWNHWIEQAKAPALTDTLKLYQKLQTSGLALIFLTRRHENQRSSTVKNLLLAGYSGWKMLIMRPEDDLQTDVQTFKSKQRLYLESLGFRIQGAIGDQWSDISGPAVGNFTFKMPNPLYHII